MLAYMFMSVWVNKKNELAYLVSKSSLFFVILVTFHRCKYQKIKEPRLLVDFKINGSKAYYK